MKNHSETPVAIQQVQTNQTVSGDKQLPCHVCGPVWGNINMIELLTSKSPDYIFQHYIQTFAPVAPNTNFAQNSMMKFNSLESGNINVTAPGQILTITLSQPFRVGQGPFDVMAERVDLQNDIISVVTLAGHPLAGWRYWRVYSIGTNDVVIETGAYDGPGPGPKNFTGYYLMRFAISKGWQEFLEYISKQADLSAIAGFHPTLSVGGIGFPQSKQLLLEGLWDYNGLYTGYLLNNICQSASCH